MKKIFYLTAHGKRELEDELQELLQGRGEVAERIAEARAFGDLSENAEYSAARDEQNRTEARIAELEKILAGAEIIAGDGDDIVSLGDTVTLKSGRKEVRYKVVGAVEADPADGKISDESALGQALMGKKLGETATVDTPKGKKTYEIVEIV
ncbi:transcription elongation factor GreA [Candidatus Saccharibacteria bacterium]|nr:transcription elongation factor GreA [Candidatus Saccharibacteria bacterium]